MNTLIVGAGAMGGLVAYLLHRSGASVMLIDKDPRIVQAVGRGGLRVEGISGTEILPVPIGDRPATRTPPELIVVLVKCHDTADAARAAAPFADARTLVLSLQNGIGNEEILAETFGAERVAGGATNLGAALLAPGHLLHTAWGDTAIAPFDPLAAERTAAAAAFLSRHGLKTTVADDLRSLRWSRVLVQIGVGAIASLTRVRHGNVLNLAPAKQLMRLAVEETARVLQAANIKLTYNSPVTQVEQYLAHTADHLPTMLQDLFKKRRTEIEALNGAVVKLAESLGLDAPVNRTLMLLVQTLEQSN